MPTDSDTEGESLPVRATVVATTVMAAVGLGAVVYWCHCRAKQMGKNQGESNQLDTSSCEVSTGKEDAVCINQEESLGDTSAEGNIEYGRVNVGADFPSTEVEVAPAAAAAAANVSHAAGKKNFTHEEGSLYDISPHREDEEGQNLIETETHEE